MSETVMTRRFGSALYATRVLAAEMRRRLSEYENLEVREQFSQELENLLELMWDVRNREPEFADYLQALCTRYNCMEALRLYLQTAYSPAK